MLCLFGFLQFLYLIIILLYLVSLCLLVCFIINRDHYHPIKQMMEIMKYWIKFLFLWGFSAVVDLSNIRLFLFFIPLNLILRTIILISSNLNLWDVDWNCIIYFNMHKQLVTESLTNDTFNLHFCSFEVLNTSFFTL